MIKRKLIEVALPLEAINREAAREKSIRHGHPSTLHLWWSRKPVAASRAALFAQLIDDPSANPERFPTLEDQRNERRRLLDLLSELVKWTNLNNTTLLAEAKSEIKRSSGDGVLPEILDPFCGGGSIPLEAQRLGLSVSASDLNPVAVLITKALTEFPQRVRGRQPVSTAGQSLIQSQGLEGLIADVRHYGRQMASIAAERLQGVLPKANTT